MADALSYASKQHRAVYRHAADEGLFRAFQSNLLSLISHELRTPLMGVINALTLLETTYEGSAISKEELLMTARRNAEKLKQTLATLLDMAAVESKTFHARLREIDLPKLAHQRIVHQKSSFRAGGLNLRIEEKTDPVLVLADPQKLGRAIDLCLGIVNQRARPKSDVFVRVTTKSLSIEFELTPTQRGSWQKAWSHAFTVIEGGISAPSSPFAGVIQSEESFLSRTEEGLGSELILIHEIMRRHQGSFEATKKTSDRVHLEIELPVLTPEEGLKGVLFSRAYQVSNELGSVALVIVTVPGRASFEEFSSKLKKALFRASDAVYPLPERGQVALVLDDCKPEDTPHLLKRFERETGMKLHTGVSHCPAESSDPEELIELALRRVNN